MSSVDMRKFFDQLAVMPWDEACEHAEQELPALQKHLGTWGKHCGAPRSVYRGHIVKMLIEIGRTDA